MKLSRQTSHGINIVLSELPRARSLNRATYSAGNSSKTQWPSSTIRASKKTVRSIRVGISSAIFCITEPPKLCPTKITFPSISSALECTTRRCGRNPDVKSPHASPPARDQEASEPLHDALSLKAVEQPLAKPIRHAMSHESSQTSYSYRFIQCLLDSFDVLHRLARSAD